MHWYLLLVVRVVVKGRTKPPDGALIHPISGVGHLLYVRKNLEVLLLHFGSWGLVAYYLIKADGTLEGTFLKNTRN